MSSVKTEGKVISLLMTVLFVLMIVSTPLFTYASGSNPDYTNADGFEIYLVASPGVTASLDVQIETTDRNNMGADAAVFNKYSTIYKCYTMTITSAHDESDIERVWLPDEDENAYIFGEGMMYLGRGSNTMS